MAIKINGPIDYNKLKTPFQQNVSQPVQQENWYKGAVPTSREMYGRIYTIGQSDPKTAKTIADGFAQSRNDPSSPYYAPYKQATNLAVKNMADLGWDTTNINDDWYTSNSVLNSHLLFNGTTNTPSSPGKGATTEQMAAYQYYQIGKAEDTTKKAEQEWAALQEEASYWAKRTDRNYSDDQIIEKLYGPDFAKKYPTLAAMDDSLQKPGEPLLELNRGVDYSRDNIYGVIWAARNGGGTGNLEADLALSANGAGNQWKEDPVISAKLDKNNRDAYDPYAVGSTMEDAGLYFGVPYFSQKWLENKERSIDWNDATAVKNYNAVADAEKRTQKAEEELAGLNRKIDECVAAGYNEDSLMKAIETEWEKCPTLKAMNDSLKSENLLPTTRAIRGTRLSDIQASAMQKREAYAENNRYLPDIAQMVANDYVAPEEREVKWTKKEEPPTEFVYGNAGQNTAAATAPAQQAEPARPEQKPAEEAKPAEAQTPAQEEQPAEEAVAAPALTVETPAEPESPAAQAQETSVPSERRTTTATAKKPERFQDVMQSNPAQAAPSTEMSLERAHEEAVQKNLDNWAPSIDEVGTPAEKAVFTAGRSPLFENVVEQYKTIRPQMDEAKASAEQHMTERTVTEYPAALRTIAHHDDLLNKIAKNNLEAEQNDARIAELEERRDNNEAQYSVILSMNELEESGEADKIREALRSDDEATRLNGYRILYNSISRISKENYALGDFNSEAEFLQAHPEMEKYAQFLMEEKYANLLPDLDWPERDRIESLAADPRADEIRSLLTSKDENDQYDGYRMLWMAMKTEDFDATYNEGGYTSIEKFIEDHPEMATYSAYFLGTAPEEPFYEPLTADEEQELEDRYATRDLLNNETTGYQQELDGMQGEYTEAVWAKNTLALDYQVNGMIYGSDPELFDAMTLSVPLMDNWVPYYQTEYNVYDHEFNDFMMWLMGAPEGRTTADMKRSVASYARSGLQDNMDSAKKIQYILDNAEALGIDLSDGKRRNLEQALKVANVGIKDAEYYLMENDDPDFDAKVQAGKEADRSGYSELTNWNIGFLLKEDHYFWTDKIKENEAFGAQFFEKPGGWTGLGRKVQELRVERCRGLLEEDDVNRYFYLLQEQGEDAANEYFLHLVNPEYGSLQNRASGDLQRVLHEKTANPDSPWDGIGWYMFSFLTNQVHNVVSPIYVFLHHLAGKDINPNAVELVWMKMTDNLRQGARDYNFKVNGEKAPGVQMWMDAWTSSLDSMITMLATKGAGNLVGLALKGAPVVGKVLGFVGAVMGGEYGVVAQKAANALYSWVMAVPMSLGAAAHEYVGVIEKGGSPEQAEQLALVTFLAESLTEMITINRIRVLEGLGKAPGGQFLLELIKSMAEETIGESLNQAWEQEANHQIMGAMSDYEQEVERLIHEEGLPRTVAEAQANRQMVRNILYAGASGALGSIFSSGASYAVGSIRGIGPRSAYNKSSIQDQNLLMDRKGTTGSTNASAVISAVLGRESRRGFNFTRMTTTDSTAAAQSLVSGICHNDGGLAMRSMRSLLSFANIENQQLLKEAVSFAALTNGKANRVMQDIVNAVESGQTLSEASVEHLLEAAQDDTTGPQAEQFEQMRKGMVRDFRIARETMMLMSLDDTALKVAETVRDGAISNLQRAQWMLEEAQRTVQSKSDAFVYASEAVQQEASLDNIQAQKLAINELDGALTAVKQMQDHVEEMQQKADDAQEKFNTLRDQKLNDYRAQAEQNVDQQIAEEERLEMDEMERTAVQQIQSVNRINAFKADLDDYIERNFNDHPQENKEHIRELAAEEQAEMDRIAQEELDKMGEEERSTQATAQDVLNQKKLAEMVEKKFGWHVRLQGENETLDYNALGETLKNARTIVISGAASTENIMKSVLVHELSHVAEMAGEQMYLDYANSLLKLNYGEDADFRSVVDGLKNGIDMRGNRLAQDLLQRKAQYDKAYGRDVGYEFAMQEHVADLMGNLLQNDEDLINRLAAEQPGVVRRIISAIRDFIRKITGTGVQNSVITDAQKTVDLMEAALKAATQNNGQQTVANQEITDRQGNAVATELEGGTAVLNEDVRHNLESFNEEEQARVRSALLSAKDQYGNRLYTPEQVDKYMKGATGIASMIANDKTRLDFAANESKFLKKNEDYYFTLDASTLCAKRLLYQGTFNAIQHLLPNEALMPDDLIDLVNIMREMGYETPCGICYVESRRRWLDKYAQEWLNDFEGIEGEPMPSLADLTTSDGLTELNTKGSPKYAPKTRKAFIDAMNAKGSANPKVVQLRTAYRGDISTLSAKDIQKVKDIGGLRIQSFSDFEVPHLLDMVQAVYDMASVGLTSQAYTKVPNFAWVFGDTGIKINLSLIGKGKGVDAQGNLVFDDVEGMPFEEAMKIRNRYTKNVGTILVGINDEHIIAAMGDSRIDFIIPFHQSGWSKFELSRIPVLNNYMDYTETQNERIILGPRYVSITDKGQKAVNNWIAKNKEAFPNYEIIKQENGKFTIRYRDGYESESFSKHKERTGEDLSNFTPVGANQYWKFEESGQWNAEHYLKMCAESNRLPKFYQFLVDNGDGSFSLPQGNDQRSTFIREGYWKTLTDFKMYENDSYGRTKEDGTKTAVKGSRQTEVTPNVNMAEAERVMSEYKLGRQMPNNGPFVPMKSNNDLPTAQPAANRFVDYIKYKRAEQNKRAEQRAADIKAQEDAGIKVKSESKEAREKRLSAENVEIYNNYSRGGAFGAYQGDALLGNVESTAEEIPAARQRNLAIDAETGETVRHMLPGWNLDEEFDKMIDDMSLEEMEEFALKEFGLSLNSPSKAANSTVEETAATEVTAPTKEATAPEENIDTSDDAYFAAVNSGDLTKVQKIVAAAAKKAGYTLYATHRSNDKFTVFDKSKRSGRNGKSLGDAFYVAKGHNTEYDSDIYGKNKMLLYVKTGNVFDIQNDSLTEDQANAVYEEYFAPYHSEEANKPDSPYRTHVIGKLQSWVSVMDYIKNAADNKNTTTDTVFEWLGYNSIKDGPQYAVFEPEQIKSAEPVVFDDDGNPIPLGKRFNFQNNDIRYMLPKAVKPSDAPYLSAVNHGNMEEAQRLVDQKAEESGYTKAAYHGTMNGGFTVFNKGKAHVGGNSGAGFYFSSNIADSEANYRNVEGADNFFKANNLASEIIGELYESGEDTIEYEGHTIAKEMTNDEIVEIAKQILAKNPQMYNVYLNQGKTYIRDFNKSTNLVEDAINNFDESQLDREDYDSEDDYLDDVSMRRSDEIYQAVSDAVYNAFSDIESNYEVYSDINYEDIISRLTETAMDYENLTWDDLIKVLQDQYIDIGTEEMTEPTDGTYEIARAIVEAFGYDSIEDREVSKKFNQLKNMGDAGDTVHYIMFRPEQIKLADPVTYDDTGEIIPPSERFNTQQDDIRYALPSDNLIREDFRRFVQNGGITWKNNPTVQTGNNQRQWGREGLQNSDEIDQNVKDWVRLHNEYAPDTNAEQVERAVNWIRGNRSNQNSDGLYESIQKVSLPDFNWRSADGQAKMISLLAMAAHNKDAVAQVMLADAYNKQGTTLGQALQARKIWRLMTPEGRVYSLENMLNQMQNELWKNGRTNELKFSDWIYQAATVAQSENDFENVRRAAIKEIAEQVPPSWKDRLTTWRMMAMLANPRTHIRNILGNAMFMPMIAMKNKLGAIAELGLKQEDRTKTLGLASPEARAFAKADADAIKDVLTGDAKYNDRGQVMQEVKVFGTRNTPLSRTVGRFLQHVSDINGKALEYEDWIFLRRHYQNALGGYMTARGLTAEDMYGTVLDEARAYAINEAQKATYRDFNKTADLLAKIGRNGGIPGFVVNAVLPFKKTPANILKRGMEYSAVGFVKSLTADAIHLKQYYDYMNGKLKVMPDKAISPSQWIDKVTAGLTGVGVMALGALLSSLGVLHAGFDDDDEFEKLRGRQGYSIDLFGQSITIDWAAPMSMPLFVGATTYNAIERALEGESFDVGELVDSIMTISEPIFNLSMLDGVNSLLDTSSYDNKNVLTQVGEKILTNYLTSFVPTLSGQVARTIDPIRRKAYVKPGESLRTLRYQQEKLENKIPFLSMTNIPYRDAFGFTDESSMFAAGMENFFSPAYINTIKDDAVIDELERLYGVVGDDNKKNMVPKLPSSFITVNKEKINLEPEQYDTYTVERGQVAYEMLHELFQTPEYSNADDETKADMVVDVWTYADKRARFIVTDGKSKKDKWIADAEESGDPVGAVINRAVKRNKDAQKEGYNVALKDSLAAGDLEGAQTSIAGLRRSEVADKTIKSNVTNYYKPLYQQAYLDGDTATMYEIESTLDVLDPEIKWDYKSWTKGLEAPDPLGWLNQ